MLRVSDRGFVRWGDFLLVERIGLGRMADVFTAKAFGAVCPSRVSPRGGGPYRRAEPPEQSSRKTVALWRLHPHVSEDVGMVDHLFEDLRQVGRIVHENVCQMTMLGAVGKQHFAVYEHLWGLSLRGLVTKARISGLRIPVPVVLAIWRQAVAALGRAHCGVAVTPSGEVAPIVHRALAPSKVFVGFDGVAKVTGFGVTRAMHHCDCTSVGVIKGRFSYMSPEQVRGLPLDPRTDIFSLGAAVYELLTGFRPFAGESDFDVLVAIRDGTVTRPVSEARPDVSEAVVDVLHMTMARERSERFGSASELGAALDALIASDYPATSRATVSDWMRATFPTELDRERYKRRFCDSIGPEQLSRGRRERSDTWVRRPPAMPDPDAWLPRSPTALPLFSADPYVAPPQPRYAFGSYAIARPLDGYCGLTRWEATAQETSVARPALPSSCPVGTELWIDVGLVADCRKEVQRLVSSQPGLCSEVALAVRLRQPGVARLLELGVAGQYVVAASEPVAGESVATLLGGQCLDRRRHWPSRRIPCAAALSIALQVANALAGIDEWRRWWAHEPPLRVDISPSNVLVSASGETHLLGVGLSRIIDLIPKTGPEGWNRYRYIAPERLAGEPGDERSELYSLGLVLYEAMAGAPWIGGNAGPSLLAAALHPADDTEARLDLAVPAGVQELVLCALQPDPARRFQSASEMARAIETTLDHDVDRPCSDDFAALCA